MNKFLHDLALSFQKQEGYFPGSLSYRLNNPGNIKFYKSLNEWYKAVPSDYGFARFPSYKIGFTALKNDLRTKILGKSRHEKLSWDNNPTFFDLVSVYAPIEDNNNPKKYAEVICNQLKDYGVTPNTLLRSIAYLIHNRSLTPEDPPPSTLLPLNKKTAHRALKRAVNRKLDAVIRVIMRLQNRL